MNYPRALFLTTIIASIAKEPGDSKCKNGLIGRRRSGAGDGIRTRDLCHGKATLYQLSYSREIMKVKGTILSLFVNEARCLKCDSLSSELCSSRIKIFVFYKNK